MKPLRTAQRGLTAERILEGAEAVLRSGKPLTFATVAEAAELPERTVYRHFETRELLDSAAWKRVLGRFANDTVPGSVAEYCAQTAVAFAHFSEDPLLVRAILHSREVTRLRRIDDSERRVALERCVASARPELSPRDRRRVAAALRVLQSAPSWELLTDLWGFDASEAAKVVEFAAKSMLSSLADPRPKRKRRPDARD